MVSRFLGFIFETVPETTELIQLFKDDDWKDIAFVKPMYRSESVQNQFETKLYFYPKQIAGRQQIDRQTHTISYDDIFDIKCQSSASWANMWRIQDFSNSKVTMSAKSHI